MKMKVNVFQTVFYALKIQEQKKSWFLELLPLSKAS